MKKLDFGQTVHLIANVGVIGGILLLAFELHQNNLFLDAQARLTRHELRSNDSLRVYIENPEVAELVIKARNSEPLTEVEKWRLSRIHRQYFLDWQFIFREYVEGALPREEVAVAAWHSTFDNWPGMAEYWNETKDGTLRRDFVEFMEDYGEIR